MGLVGSLHCAGMCGPIAFALPFDRSHWFKSFLGNYLYQFGRIFTYGFLGLMIGFIGRGFSLSGLQQPLSIGVGIIMILAVVLPQLPIFRKAQSSFTLKVSKIKSLLGVYIHKKSYRALFITGLINGLLPCGLVYMALLGALGMGNAIEGSLFMILFGIGTFPMMFIIGFLGNILSAGVRKKFQKAVPIFVFVIGVLFILRGSGLGIKYLSPSDGSLQIEQTQECQDP